MLPLWRYGCPPVLSILGRLCGGYHCSRLPRENFRTNGSFSFVLKDFPYYREAIPLFLDRLEELVRC